MLTNYERRKYRVRNKIASCNKSNRPRVVVCRSNKNLSVQLINSEGKVLKSASTAKFDSKEKASGVDKAKSLGKEFAGICTKDGILEVVFDKGAYAYNGRVKALAEACREAGLKF